MSSDENELILPVIEEENICLPLSINVVAKYWNVDLPIFEAQETAKKYPENSGNILIEGIELAERHGLTCKIFNSSIKQLKKFIDTGIPLIVILPGIENITQHASIISGYDNTEKTLIHYVPKSNEEGTLQGAIPEKLFEKKWFQDGKIVIVIAPSDILSSLNLENESKEKSYRQYLNSERQILQKNISDATNSLKQAIELDQTNSSAFSSLGGILNEQNYPECVEQYNKAIQLNPNCYLAYRGLGNYHLKSQNFKESEKCYTKAIEIDHERSGSIYKNRAYVREKLQKISEVKDDLKNYLKYSPRAKDRGTIEQAIREL